LVAPARETETLRHTVCPPHRDPHRGRSVSPKSLLMKNFGHFPVSRQNDHRVDHPWQGNAFANFSPRVD